MDKQRVHKMTLKEFRHMDPMLKNPDQNVEQNLAEGIEEMMPDPDDVPSGFNENGTQRPDLMEADANCFTEQRLLKIKILSLRESSKVKQSEGVVFAAAFVSD